MQRFHLAQFNLARAVVPLDDQRLADFYALLDEINAVGDASPGFVWRLVGDGGNATDVRISGDPRVIVNMTVWKSVDALRAFTYRSDHKGVFARRSDWFERWEGPNYVLWWVPAGYIPTVDEAVERLNLLAERGPSADAFSIRQSFDPPRSGALSAAIDAEAVG